MFDTQTRRSQIVNIRSVAQETYFNDAHRRAHGIVTDGQSNDLFERHFGIWEDQMAEVRNAALVMAEGKRQGTWEERRVMATCAALQLLRTRQARNYLLWELGAGGDRRGVLTPFLSERLQRRMEGDEGFVRENIALIHSDLLWGATSAVPAFARELFHYIWIIARNSTPHPFYTSDAPIASLSHAPGDGPYFPSPGSFYGGYGEISLAKRLFSDTPHDGGQELIFPLAPDCALLMFHPYDFDQELADKQGEVLVLGWKGAMIRNVVIGGSAVRQVFSSTNNFDIAQDAMRILDSKERRGVTPAA